MASPVALNIFLEPQPVTAYSVTARGERVQAYGVVQMTEYPYIKAQFPQSNLKEVKKIEEGARILVCLEIDHTVMTLYTRMVEDTDHGALLLKIEEYDRKKQRRVATRVPAGEAWAEYRPLEEQASRFQREKNRAEIVNISKTGVLMRLNEVVEPNQRVELALHLWEIGLINCLGRVVRLALQRSGEIEAAVQFEDLNNSGQAGIDKYFAET
jgi:c-di-GMP-binding flagellar brake protein YcgR